MRPGTTIRFKGWALLIAGALFAPFPAQMIELMGATLGDAGAIMTRLLGLLLLGMGFSMAFGPKPVPSRSEALVYLLTDFIALSLLYMASTNKVFNVLGYVLAAIYLLSAVNFFYYFVSQRG